MKFEKIKSIFHERFVLQQEYNNTKNKVNSLEPLVSVVVSTYQHFPYIKDCLDSILMQKTSFSFEIIIGEDDSNDGTREICIEYANKYPEYIRLFLRDRKLSHLYDDNGDLIIMLNDTWNKLSAKGKYIAWCDGDDYWTDPSKLQKQIDFLENNKKFVICYHDSRVVDKNNNTTVSSRFKNYRSDYSKNHMLGGPFIPTNTAMFRNVIKEYPEAYFKSTNYDTFLWHLLGFYGGGKFLKNINNSVYRIHGKNLWANYSIKEKIKNLIYTRTIIKNNLENILGNSHIATIDQKKRIRILHKQYFFQAIKEIPFFGTLFKLTFTYFKNIIYGVK